jgi:hypothetical protein
MKALPYLNLVTHMVVGVMLERDTEVNHFTWLMS